MAVILLTGMSGAGKSTALAGLARRGIRVVDTDVGGWIEQVRQADGTLEPLWIRSRIDALLAGHETSGEPLVIAGTVANQGAFRDRLDRVVLLSAPLPVLLERVARRTDNPFGRSPAERDRIIADTLEIEPRLRAAADVEIDTRRPPNEVVEELIALARARSTRQRRQE